MIQYIDKSVLVTEIERLISEIYGGQSFDSLSREKQVALWYIKSIMSSIYTLEVKEVDLEKDVDKILEENDWDYDEIDFYDFAKHFYELGIKAQKGE